MLVGKNKYSSGGAFLKTLRVSFVDKLNLRNTYLIAAPTASVVIDLKNLEDFDNSRLVAAMFALRLLTGCKPYVARFGLFQTFKEKNYDMLVRVNVGANKIFSFLEILAYEILPFIAKADCSASALIEEKGTVVLFAISDLSFIRVVETHSIFFKWHDVVKVRLYFPTSTICEAEVYLSAFKLDWDFFTAK